VIRMLGLKRKPEDPVRVVQDSLSATATMNLGAMIAALQAIIEGNLWQRDNTFESFGEFAVALPPVGLGVRSLAPLRLLRGALIDAGHIACWTEVLERVVRAPGRPRKKLANDEGFEPFYTVPTASTSQDRLLLALKRNHPEHFAAVCELKKSPRAAAIEAGLLTNDPPRYGGACNIEVAARLSERAQGRLLCELFDALSPNAQCDLIARKLEPSLGFNLAQRWRDCAATNKTTSSGGSSAGN